MREVNVTYTRDGVDRTWLVEIDGIPGAHTHGRSIQEARSRIEEVIALHLEDEEVEVSEFFVVDDQQHVVDLYNATRQTADELLENVYRYRRQAIETLVSQGLSYRDVGAILDLSPQRVHQLVHEGGR